MNGIVTIHYFHAERYKLPRIPVNVTLPPDYKSTTAPINDEDDEAWN
eukprot:CAMPEP_0172478218 /NCGR_PEP_ID=MMETSP1066-20121228/2007_1 /TAXON_ID=671091 /ORGANISM="Coscinodiscus wailesii, Strain CCMP2513" /LENGTH=46 /DNA_ID= /DNA_START= /DNA_END= /DNA_ORIENTATION=